MPLIDILADFCADSGMRADVPAQRERAVSLINDAALEMYSHNDLQDCLWEQVFEFSIDEQQVTLPWYIETPRALRDYDALNAIDMTDTRPRYATLGWAENFYDTFRVKRRGAPLARNIGDVTKLTFALPDGEVAADAFTVTVVGKTASAARAQETLVWSVGDSADKITTNLYEDVELIRKNVITTQDLTVTDGDGNTLALLPNNQLQTYYTLLQVLDKYQTLGNTRLVEVLYKKKFVPFQNDYDEFACGSQYDKAIYYKAFSLWKAKFDDAGSLATAAAYEAKCGEMLAKLAINKSGSNRKKLDFGRNRFRNNVLTTSPAYRNSILGPYTGYRQW